MLGYVALFAYFATRANDTFLTAGTMRTILDQASVPLILAVGLTVILAAGEFDLSYTATVGLSGGIAVIAMTEQGFPVGWAIVVALVVGALAGLVVGVLVTATTASSFIVTLAVGSVLTGLELALTDNTTIYTGIPTAYADLSRFDILTIRLPVWIALAVVVAGLLVMHRSTFGRHVQAVGGNNLAAFFAGVPVRRVRIAAFVVLGVLAAIAALILTSRSASYYPNAAAGQLLSTYAACFLGASVLSRPGFSVAGSTLGVLWIVTLQVGLTIMNEPTWLVSLIQGVVLAGAILLATKGRRA